MTPELQRLIALAAVTIAAMTPEERAAHFAEQRLSYARGEAGMGNDAEEAAYRAGLAHAGTNLRAIYSDPDERSFYEQGLRDGSRRSA